MYVDRLSGYGSGRNVAPGHPALLWVRSPFLPRGPSPGGAILLCSLSPFMRRVVFDLPPRGRCRGNRGGRSYQRVKTPSVTASRATSPKGGGQGPLALGGAFVRTRSGAWAVKTPLAGREGGRVQTTRRVVKPRLRGERHDLSAKKGPIPSLYGKFLKERGARGEGKLFSKSFPSPRGLTPPKNPHRAAVKGEMAGRRRKKRAADGRKGGKRRTGGREDGEKRTENGPGTAGKERPGGG